MPSSSVSVGRRRCGRPVDWIPFFDLRISICLAGRNCSDRNSGGPWLFAVFVGMVAGTPRSADGRGVGLGVCVLVWFGRVGVGFGPVYFSIGLFVLFLRAVHRVGVQLLGCLPSPWWAPLGRPAAGLDSASTSVYWFGSVGLVLVLLSVFGPAYFPIGLLFYF